MLIITDSIPAAEKYLGPGLEWLERNLDELDPIAADLFLSQPAVMVHEDKDVSWHSLYITSYAKSSQFEFMSRLMRRNELKSGLIVFCAEAGSNFRGYHNRSWVTVAGNIHLSVFFKPEVFIEFFEVAFTVMAVVSMVQAIDRVNTLQSQACIKWINDILVDRAKVGGVIVHTQASNRIIHGVVIGLGLNVEKTPHVTPDIFVPAVASLSQFAPCEKHQVFRNLLFFLRKNYVGLLNGEYAELLEIYRSRSAIMGKRVRLYSDPRSGEPRLLNEGNLTRIGNNLELYFKHTDTPHYSGRLAFI